MKEKFYYKWEWFNGNQGIIGGCGVILYPPINCNDGKKVCFRHGYNKWELGYIGDGDSTIEIMFALPLYAKQFELKYQKLKREEKLKRLMG